MMELHRAMAGLSACVAALLASYVATPIAIRIARRFNIFDAPDNDRRVHRIPIPRIGGIGVLAGVAAGLAVVLLASESSLSRLHLLLPVVAGALILAIMGFVDDIRGVRPIRKVVCQIAAGAIIVSAGVYPRAIALVPGLEFHVGYLGAVLMVLWIIVATNAYNLIDGLNGLASGIGMIAILCAVVAAWITGSVEAYVSAVVFGALLGFLPHNFPRARVFLGDVGTMSIGFFLAVVLVQAATMPDGALLLPVPIFALLVPLLDTTLAIIRRWLRGMPVSGADARHVHHRLLAIGFSHQRSTVTLWVFAAVFMSFGLLSFAAPALFTGVFFVILVAGAAAIVVYMARLLAYHEFKVVRGVIARAPTRAMQLIRDEIRAVDLGPAIQSAAGIEELNAILEASASEFGFSSIQLHLRDERHRYPELGSHSHPGWCFDYYLKLPEAALDVGRLHICCSAADGRTSGAERLALMLMPHLQEWLARQLEPNTGIRAHNIA